MAKGYQVKSSALDIVGFEPHPTLPILFVLFKSGGFYAYEGVPHGVFRELMEADSIGSFFSAKIKGQYPSVPCTDSFSEVVGADQYWDDLVEKPKPLHPEGNRLRVSMKKLTAPWAW